MNIFKQKMTLTVDVFPKLQTANNVFRQIAKTSRFGRPFDKQHNKPSQTLLKSALRHLYHIYWSLLRKLSWKPLLVICRIVGLFVDTLNTNDKYSLLNRDNLMQPIEMQLSKKQNTFSGPFSAFLKSKSNIKYVPNTVEISTTA